MAKLQIPWALRDVIADERVEYLFGKDFAELRDAFDQWQPRTSILRDLKRKIPASKVCCSARGQVDTPCYFRWDDTLVPCNAS